MPRPGGGSQSGSASPRQRLLDAIRNWKKLRNQIENILDKPGAEITNAAKLNQLRRQRENVVNGIVNLVNQNNSLYKVAVNQGFREDLLDPTRSETQHGVGGGAGGGAGGGGGGQGGGGQGGGGGGRGGGGGGKGGGKGGGGKSKADLRAQAADNRLLGDKGKDYYIARGPSGAYVAVYTYRIRGETVRVGVKIPRNKLGKYGVKEGEGRRLTKAQLKRVKNIGWADELAPHVRKGDSNMLKALVRSLGHQYGGQPILHNDGVMATIIANTMFGWTPGEFENELRNTRWYKRTNEYQRDWQLTISPKQKKDTVRSTLEQVTNHLEDVYGLDWTKHVKGGMKTARGWAQSIAAGKWGEPGQGFEFWSENAFDRAAKIEGTNAWIQNQSEQEERRAFLNRPEDKFEELRSQALAYLGYAGNNTPVIPRGTLKAWANDIVTEKRSEGDWMNFLRNQMRNLHPYFDPNTPFQDQASAYKSVLESVLRTQVGWDDPMLRNFAGEEGKALSLHDFELRARDPDRNPRAWQEGTALFDEGINTVALLERQLMGVGS